MNLLVEGLLNYPSIHLEETDHKALELRRLFAKLEEAEVEDPSDCQYQLSFV